MREGESLFVDCAARVTLQRVLAPIAQRKERLSAFEANRLADGRAGVDAGLLFHAQRHLGDFRDRRIQSHLPVPECLFGAVNPYLNALRIHVQMERMSPRRRLAPVPADASLLVRGGFIHKLGRLGEPGQPRRRTVSHRCCRLLQKSSIRPQWLGRRLDTSEQEKVQPFLQEDLCRCLNRLPGTVRLQSLPVQPRLLHLPAVGPQMKVPVPSPRRPHMCVQIAHALFMVVGNVKAEK